MTEPETTRDRGINMSKDATYKKCARYPTEKPEIWLVNTQSRNNQPGIMTVGYCLLCRISNGVRHDLRRGVHIDRMEKLHDILGHYVEARKIDHSTKARVLYECYEAQTRAVRDSTAAPEHAPQASGSLRSVNKRKVAACNTPRPQILSVDEQAESSEPSSPDPPARKSGLYGQDISTVALKFNGPIVQVDTRGGRDVKALLRLLEIPLEYEEA